MINKMKMRTGRKNKTRSSANYLLKTNPEGDAIDCTIPRLEGESNMEYATRIKDVFEGDRVHNQKNLYQFNALSLHPSEGEKFTDAQMIQMAKEVYLYNGVKNGLNDNRHYMFVVERDKDHHHVHAMIHLTDLSTKKVNNKMIDYNPIIKKLELKYGLYNEHRKPKTEDEYKKKFKTDLKAILDNALTASEFLMLANGAGFDIHHSGKDAYSLTKDDQTFKASDLAVSYKTLKAALGDDPEFAATLTLLHKDKPGNDGSTSIKAPTEEAPAPEAPTNQPQKKPAPAPAPDHEPDQDENGYSDYGSQSSEDRRKERADYFKGIRMQKTLYKNYHHDEDGNYYFNRNNMKAFEFDASSNTVTHRSATPSSVKAGLQKLTEDGKPCSLYTQGGEKYKRETWLQFHLMKLDEKGYSLDGFKPSKQDLELLEQKLADKNKFYNRKEESNVKALPTQSVVEKPVVSLDKKENEKPAEKITDTESKNISGAVSNIANVAVKVAANVLDGAVEKMADMTQSFSAGTMEEKLSEMRALDAGIQSQKNEAEDVHYQNERRRRNQLRPD